MSIQRGEDMSGSVKHGDAEEYDPQHMVEGVDDIEATQTHRSIDVLAVPNFDKLTQVLDGLPRSNNEAHGYDSLSEAMTDS